MTMKIISMKMVTGEELVTELVGTKFVGESTTYTLRRPHILQVQQVAPGKLGLVFVPWALSNPDIDIVEVPASAVITTFSPAGKIEAQYLQETSSIQIAAAGSI